MYFNSKYMLQFYWRQKGGGGVEHFNEINFNVD